MNRYSYIVPSVDEDLKKTKKKKQPNITFQQKPNNLSSSFAYYVSKYAHFD